MSGEVMTTFGSGGGGVYTGPLASLVMSGETMAAFGSGGGGVYTGVLASLAMSSGGAVAVIGSVGVGGIYAGLSPSESRGAEVDVDTSDKGDSEAFARGDAGC